MIQMIQYQEGYLSTTFPKLATVKIAAVTEEW